MLPEDIPSCLSELVLTLPKYVKDFSNYNCDRLIAKGSTAEIWHAIEIDSKRECAVKKLLTKKLNKNQKKSFLREVYITITCKCPFIVPVIGYTVKRPYCIIMQYIRGGTLKNFIHPGMPNFNVLSPTQLTTIAMFLAEGLRKLEEEKVIHRDLRPENILLTEDLFPVICDFGVARVIDDVAPMSIRKGSLTYMSPELYNKVKYTTRSDVFSFALLLYEMSEKTQVYSGIPLSELERAKTNKFTRPEFHKTEGSIKSLIEKCWKEFYNERPSFDYICKAFEEGKVEFPGTNSSNVQKAINHAENTRFGLKVHNSRLDVQEIVNKLKEREYKEENENIINGSEDDEDDKNNGMIIDPSNLDELVNKKINEKPDEEEKEYDEQEMEHRELITNMKGNINALYLKGKQKNDALKMQNMSTGKLLASRRMGSSRNLGISVQKYTTRRASQLESGQHPESMPSPSSYFPTETVPIHEGALLHQPGLKTSDLIVNNVNPVPQRALKIPTDPSDPNYSKQLHSFAMALNENNIENFYGATCRFILDILDTSIVADVLKAYAEGIYACPEFAEYLNTKGFITRLPVSSDLAIDATLDVIAAIFFVAPKLLTDKVLQWITFFFSCRSKEILKIYSQFFDKCKSLVDFIPVIDLLIENSNIFVAVGKIAPLYISVLTKLYGNTKIVDIVGDKIISQIQHCMDSQIPAVAATAFACITQMYNSSIKIDMKLVLRQASRPDLAESIVGLLICMKDELKPTKDLKVTLIHLANKSPKGAAILFYEVKRMPELAVIIASDNSWYSKGLPTMDETLKLILFLATSERTKKVMLNLSFVPSLFKALLSAPDVNANGTMLLLSTKIKPTEQTVESLTKEGFFDVLVKKLPTMTDANIIAGVLHMICQLSPLAQNNVFKTLVIPLIKLGAKHKQLSGAVTKTLSVLASQKSVKLFMKTKKMKKMFNDLSKIKGLKEVAKSGARKI